MTESRSDPNRVDAVGINVFELRAGIRAREAVPPRPRLGARIGRRALLTVTQSGQLIARKWPVARGMAEQLLRRSLEVVEGAIRSARTTRPPNIGAALRRFHFDRGHAMPQDPLPAEATPELGDDDPDDPILRQALLRLATREYAYGAHDPTVASELHFIGALHHESGRYDEALAYYGLALAIRERVLAPEHPELASTLEDLAAIRETQGETAEAMQLLARAERLRVQYRRLNASLAAGAD